MPAKYSACGAQLIDSHVEWKTNRFSGFLSILKARGEPSPTDHSLQATIMRMKVGQAAQCVSICAATLAGTRVSVNENVHARTQEASQVTHAIWSPKPQSPNPRTEPQQGI